jgi:hypothetical protein
MKTILKLIALSAGFMLSSIIQPVFASSVIDPKPQGLPAKFLDMKVSDFIKLSAKDFSAITGNKMRLKEKISLSLLKKDMKRSLKKNSDQIVKDYLATADKKGNTALLIIIIVVVVVLIAVLLAGSIGPGPISWGG